MNMIINDNMQHTPEEITGNEELKNMVKTVGNGMKSHEYYKEIDCPMPILNKLQQNLIQSLNELYYSEDKDQLTTKNEIVFIDNGILLFDRFNIFIGEDGKMYFKVLTVLDKFWIEKLLMINNKISELTSLLTAYTEQLSSIGNVNDVPYSVVDEIKSHIDTCVVGESLEFDVPLVSSNLSYNKVIMRYTRINNISFVYVLLGYIKMNTSSNQNIYESEICSGTLPLTKRNEFINKLFYNNEILK